MKKILFITMLLTAACSSAPKQATRFPDTKISLETQKMGARDCLVSLLQESGLKYRVPATLNNTTKISLDAREKPWGEVFKMAAQQAGYKYYFTQNHVLVLQPVVKR